jgi:hypothetical protein
MTSLIRYLATDNCMSLNALDTALEQLRAVDAAHATFLERIHTDGVARTAAAITGEPLRTCDLYTLYSELGVACPTCTAATQPMQRLICPLLDPATPVPPQLLLDVIHYTLVGR